MECGAFFPKKIVVFWWGLRPRPWADPRNDMSITFLQQILSRKLLLVVIVKAKK